jgi:hypothetical protein
MADYCEDAEFDAEDIPALAAELDRARTGTADEGLRTLLAAIRKLTDRAGATLKPAHRLGSTRNPGSSARFVSSLPN